MTKNDNKKLKEIIDLACEEAKRLGNTKVSPEHLFLGMLRMDQARAIDVLIALGVDFYEVKAKIEQKLNKQRDKSEEMPDELDLTLAANSIVKRVIEEAWKLQRPLHAGAFSLPCGYRQQQHPGLQRNQL